jgi:hypothetical protein
MAAGTKRKAAKKSAKPRKPVAKPSARKTVKPKLLSGGNPQIAKSEGDAPVKAYIAAITGWKQKAARDFDALIVRTVPNVKKAVKWNSPFYGVEGQGWFLSFHCFSKYLKVIFFHGVALDPLPPVASKTKNVRYFHIHENEKLDGKLVAKWLKQAAKIPGWMA